MQIKTFSPKMWHGNAKMSDTRDLELLEQYIMMILYFVITKTEE